MMKLRRLEQRGDTIVEVLIVLVIISTILAGAYATSNRTLNNSRQAQERSEAVKLVEAQIEQLRYIEDKLDRGKNIISCIGVDLIPTQPNELVPAYKPPNDDKTYRIGANTDAEDPFGNYVSRCVQAINGGVPYHLSIDHEKFSNVYTFRARWDRAGGGGRDEVSLIYAILGGPKAAATSFCGYACIVQKRADKACGGRCTRPPKPPSDPDYFSWTFGNISSESAPTCDWDLGDGTIKSNVACSPQQGFGYNYYLEKPSNFPGYPNNYTCRQFFWKLIMHYPSGDEVYDKDALGRPLHTDYIPRNGKADGSPCP